MRSTIELIAMGAPAIVALVAALYVWINCRGRRKKTFVIQAVLKEPWRWMKN